MKKNNFANKKTKDYNAFQLTIHPWNISETITSIQCSKGHTLALTSVGTVYSFGSGEDGQLGHGSLDSCKNFRLIEWFLRQKEQKIIISQV